MFRPLGSENRERIWELLVRLHDVFFGPDASLPPEDGFLHRTITSEIERYLLETPQWAEDSGTRPEASPQERANQYLDRLIESGWLRVERAGVRNFIVMPPVVQKLLELLQQFAEEGAPLVGGKVQVIYNNLLAVESDPAGQAQSLPETAKQARALVASLAGIGIRVREVMERLSNEESPGRFVASFFRDYIAELYIRDYQDMRTHNHPLRHRHDIVRIAYRLRDDIEMRRILLDAYSRIYRPGHGPTAHELFERDIQRLLKFQEVQQYLDRVDDSVTRATRQALSYLRYKLRSNDRIEVVIANTIAVLNSPERSGDTEIPTAFAPGLLFSEERLRPPARSTEEIRPPTMRRASLTPEQRARAELWRAMTRARQITRLQIRRYALAHLPVGVRVVADQLPVREVADLVMLMAFSRAAFLSARLSPAALRHVPLMATVSGLVFRLVPGELTETEHVRFPRFTIERRGEL
ncbi:DUF5716 family protein (plasmid) [Synechocystis sp. B12]|nr:DUF5716 family protein [Synechocystis sp. B12]